ncbi:RWD domain-containing protein 2B isoform X2 [Gadus morhua]|uniref:RWD domain-containing protein 2B isoform X2 n=1 Tax=Gadus morhua TaxID=8049 RepID=UPI0011B644AE|nr:RWD domain-containing protein 2B isoform X2 [Gadus morhua]
MSQLEWAESQLAEIELLSSMYPTESEFEITDQVALAELRESVEGPFSDAPPHHSRPQFLLRQRVDTSCHGGVYRSEPGPTNASPSGPYSLPAGELQRGGVCPDGRGVAEGQRPALRRPHLPGLFCGGGDRGGGGVQPTVDLQPPHLQQEQEEKHPGVVQGVGSLRVQHARETGRCLRGGTARRLRGVLVKLPALHRLKVLTWKKIMIRHREDVTLEEGRGQADDEGGVASLRKFSGFEEASFDPHGNRGNHMDLGLLYQFLSERGCCEVFQMYFGVEGR